MHARHKDQLTRLNKISGQVQGIKKMIEEERYCIDILNQTKAVTSALKKVELSILENHIHHCLKNAALSQDPEQISEKMDEIMALIHSRF